MTCLALPTFRRFRRYWYDLVQICYPRRHPREYRRPKACAYGAANVRECGNQRNRTCRSEWYSCAHQHFEMQCRLILSSAMSGLYKE